MNIQGFIESLPIMRYGMLGIFIVILVILLCMRLLTKLFPPKSDDKK